MPPPLPPSPPPTPSPSSPIVPTALVPPSTPAADSVSLPDWARELVTQYEGSAASQFILHGNVSDCMWLPTAKGSTIGSLTDFLMQSLMPRFDVVLGYDLGNGIRVEKGSDILADWPLLKREAKWPVSPRPAMEFLNQFFRYSANLARLGHQPLQVGCYIRAAQLVVPAGFAASANDVAAMALLIRDWASDGILTDHALATFLIADNLSDLHPLIVNNPRAARIKVPLPGTPELKASLTLLAQRLPVALSSFADSLDVPARQLAGATLASIESLLRIREHQRQPIVAADWVKLKKELVERDCDGLIDFVESRKTLDDLYGMEKAKAWLRQDIALWNAGDLAAMPMGYLICGPVGTGKTFMVECLAGEAGVPVVKLKNFRDKWVGSTEGNLEKIFRLLHALGRCMVFVDEADQALGRRDQSGNDSGLSGRVYGMIAQEMSDTSNRGRIVWVLASSRPDLIEVDLKRPGRIDVRIPIFPTTTAKEGFDLIRALSKRRGMTLEEKDFALLQSVIPTMLTPGAAETLAVKLYRMTRAESVSPVEGLRRILADYQNPIPADIIQGQIQLAVREATDLEFVPPPFRSVASFH